MAYAYSVVGETQEAREEETAKSSPTRVSLEDRLQDIVFELIEEDLISSLSRPKNPA